MAQPTVPGAPPDPHGEAIRRVSRPLTILGVVLLIGIMAALIVNGATGDRSDESIFLRAGALFAALLGIAILAQAHLPVAAYHVALVRGERRALSDQVRSAASIAAIAGLWYGWIVADQALVRTAAVVGAAIMVLAVPAVPAALLSPAVRRFSLGRNLAVLLVPVGLLALSGFAHSMDSAYRAAMRSDLRRYVEWQDAQRARTGSYASAPDSGFTWSQRVAPVSSSGDATRFAIAVRYEGLAATCAVGTGEVPVPPAVTEREPGCTVPTRPELLVGGLMYLAGAVLATGMLAWRRVR